MRYLPTVRNRSWDPFVELQHEMNRLFGAQEPFNDGVRSPSLNLWSNGESVVVTAEVPGVDPKNLDVTVEGDQLTVKGERNVEAADEDAVWHRTERKSGSFLRTVRLPFEVENDQVKAVYEKGVLTITLPRSQATKPAKIKVKSA